MTNTTRILRAPVRAIVWTLDLCDPKGDPSLSKGMAFFFAALIGYDAFRRGVTGMNTAAMALVISAAFGRSVFMNWLTRNSWSNNATTITNIDAAKVIEATAKAALDRRNAEKGFESSGKVPEPHGD